MILIVKTRWNSQVTDSLADSAAEVLRRQKIEFQTLQVPGALEIPLAIQWTYDALKKEGTDLLGAIACGTVVKGDTYHFEVVANESARALMTLSLELKIPITNAILVVYQWEQALERSRNSQPLNESHKTHGSYVLQNKGGEAAEALIDMLRILSR